MELFLSFKAVEKGKKGRRSILARDALPDHGARWGRFARQLSRGFWNSPQMDLGVLHIRLLRQPKSKAFVLFRGLAILGTAHHFPNGRPGTQRPPNPT